MLKRNAILVLVSMLQCFLPTLALGVSAGQHPLDKRVSVAAANGSLSDYLISLFKSAEIPGGVAVVNEKCTDSSGSFPEFTGDVRGALEKLVSLGYAVHWFELDGLLVVHNTASPPPLLQSPIQEFTFSRKEPLVAVSSALLDLPGPRSRAQDLHLDQYGPELGFASLKQPSTPADMVTLRNTTVLRALNSISGDHGVWLYKESDCERRITSLNWPVR